MSIGMPCTRTLLASALCLLAAGAAMARAADATAGTPAKTEEKPPNKWSNSTELSYVLTQGNSTVESLGFKDTFEYKPANGRMRIKLDSLHSLTSDDPFLQVQSGITFVPGDVPTNFTTNTVRPSTEPDVTRDFVEGRYDGDLSKQVTWNAGASWDRNLDAGIVSRSIVFGGLGNVWRDDKDFKFRSSYGLSYTDRQEDIHDPEKDERFPGARVTAYFMDKWWNTTTYDADLTYNVSLTDLNDWNADLTQGLAVGMNKWLSLKVSLQLTYASEPALEDVDLIVRAILVDPDGIPGTGDEFYQTVDSGGIEIKVGEDVLRKLNLDTTFRTSLLIHF
jgi:putative salt-induced outer membrane protein YdiY